MEVLDMSQEDDYLNAHDRNEIHALFGDQGEDSEQMAFGEGGAKSKKPGKRAREARRKRDFALLKREAEQGDPDAMYQLAAAYATGDGVAREPGRAFDLLEDCVRSDGSHLGALNDLAVVYAGGLAGKVKPDARRCVELLRRSSDLGLAMATFNLAVCFDQGLGCVQDAETAFDLYETAARGGVAAAHYNMGIAYRDGEGVPRDLAQALRHLEKAAAESNEDSAVRVAAASAAAGLLLAQAACRQRNITSPAAVAAFMDESHDSSDDGLAGLAAPSADKAARAAAPPAEAAEVQALVQRALDVLEGAISAADAASGARDSGGGGGNGMRLGEDGGEQDPWAASAKARMRLGRLLLGSVYVEKDVVRGQELLRQAASLGEPHARRMLRELMPESDKQRGQLQGSNHREGSKREAGHGRAVARDGGGGEHRDHTAKHGRERSERIERTKREGRKGDRGSGDAQGFSSSAVSRPGKDEAREATKEQKRKSKRTTKRKLEND